MAQVHYAALRPRDAVAELGRWSVAGCVDWREWDGEFVVRADSSAATYLLSALPGATLEAMRDGATYLDEIAARVFSGCAPSAATAALVATFAETSPDMQSLLAVLAELEALGLVRADLA